MASGSVDLHYVVGIIGLGVVIVGVALLIAALTYPFTRRLPRSLVAHYVPPPGDITQHGFALRANRRVLAATIVQLAVHKKIQVLAPQGKRGPVAMVVIAGAMLTNQEHSFLQSFRPSLRSRRKQEKYVRALADIGIHVQRPEEAPDVYFLKGKGAFRGYQRRALSAYFESAREQMKKDGLTRKYAVSVHLYVLSLLFLTLALFGLIFIIGAAMNGDWLGVGVTVLTMVGVFFALTIAPPPILLFTDQGKELRRHLSGLRDYVRLAEQDRLQFLQSPQGALRTPAGALTPGGQALGLQPQPTAPHALAQAGLDQYVLIERLLPYAVLFRCEREWEREFEYLGTVDATAQNLRALGTTLQTTAAVFEALSVVVQILRLLGAFLSLFRNA
ncbi:DUF2207 family protein [Microbacterium sp. YY-01]|uniref:DUF2207 family protein n=1 Tax=Microbacterium sp. YY-01 TaxID=3421634 RepID=UPI003D17271F